MRRAIHVLFVLALAGGLVCSACGSAPDSASNQPGAAADGKGGSAKRSGILGTGPRTATLDAGTQIKVRTSSVLSTKTAKSGDKFEAVLDAPLAVGDWTIARPGATVTGRVVDSDPGGRVKGVAHITVSLDSIATADGQTIDVTTDSITGQAKATKKKDAAKVGIGAGAGAIIGAIAGGGKGAAIGAAAGGAAGTGLVLATRGDAAVIPAETLLTFTLKSPVSVTEKK